MQFTNLPFLLVMYLTRDRFPFSSVQIQMISMIYVDENIPLI